MNVQDDHSGSPERNGASVLDAVRSLHSSSSLCGEPRNALLNVSDDLLSYLIALLRDETPRCPGSPIGEWQELLSLLNPHWLQPLAYWQIAHAPPAARPPGEIVDALRLAYLKSKARSLVVDRQIREIAHALGEDGTRFLVLKGPALARTVYPDVALRSGSDIDILVLPERVRRTGRALESIGYGCIDKQFDKSENFYYDEAFFHKDTSKGYLSVEVHWDINHVSSIRSIDVDSLFSRSVRVASDGYAFETLSPIDHVINSASHIGLKHNNDIRLSWVYDISLLCKGLGPDGWRVLQKMSVDCGARIALERSLTMARYWTGLQIPEEFSDFSRWPAPTEKELEALSLAKQRRRKAIGQIELILSGPGALSEKIKVLMYRAFPPPSIVRKQNKLTSNWLLPYYYIRRLLR